MYTFDAMFYHSVVSCSLISLRERKLITLEFIAAMKSGTSSTCLNKHNWMGGSFSSVKMISKVTWDT